MKATLKRLSVCPCGFPALHDHIKLGAEYDIDPGMKITAVFTCGGCGKTESIVAVMVEPSGFLPEILFEEPASESPKMMKLTDILSETQLDEVERLLKESEGDRMKSTVVLRRYLSLFKNELESKGVNSDYLAYVIAYKQWTGGDNGDRVVAFSA